jgi:hypothetical protein
VNEAQQQHPTGDALIGATLVRSRHLSLMTRLAAGAFYGVTAGALLHDHAGIAGAVMVAVWTATVWLPTSIRAPGEARTPQ